MPELSENIIDKNINTLSRNSPLALVVGAAGFIGSQLCEELLKKNIQVIGVDNFSTGKKENLGEAVKNRKFHLLNLNASSLKVEVTRVDYIFICAGPDWNLSSLLEIAKKFNSKLVFISSIELYDRNKPFPISWFKEAESKIARFATENNLNARIVRLASVFGPRMHFKVDEPVIRLIQASLLGELQKESTALEFSSRALYVSDAVDLIIKSMLSGSTAQKIFDGVNDPVKISEIKQILLDPIWHETRRFSPSELPPWPTPNLENTKKHLFWKPKTNIVTALRTTLHYFKEFEADVPPMETNISTLKPEPKMEVAGEFKERVKAWEKDIRDDMKKTEKTKLKLFSRQKIILLLIWVFIIYGLFYPILGLLWNSYLFKENTQFAEMNLNNGEIRKAKENLLSAKNNLKFADDLVGSLELPLEVGVLNRNLSFAKEYLKFYDRTLINLENAINGTQSLYDSFKVISGEKDGILKDNLESAAVQLESAHLDLSETLIDLKKSNHSSLGFINIDYYIQLTSRNKTFAKILPQLIPGEGKKSYLLVIEDNSKLIGSGGEILTVSRIDFENGKLKAIETDDVSLIDSNLAIFSEPPPLLKNDLNIQKGGLEYANFDADFPTAAKLMSWYYNKSKGKTLDGIVTIDTEALENLSEIVGKESVEDKDVNKLLNKIFFIPDLNWPKIVSWFGGGVESKHILVYFENKKIFSFLIAEGFSASMPRPSNEQFDLLSVFETSIGEDRSNDYSDRRFNLTTRIDNLGSIIHNLKISYTNANPAGSSYKNRMRIYLPAGSKLIKASLGESDLMKTSTSTIEYGRLVYTFIFEMLPKEQKSLILEYEVPIKLNLSSESTNYRLDIIKQPGTSSEPFEWRITYPENLLKTKSQTNIVTDLGKDRSFAVEFEK